MLQLAFGLSHQFRPSGLNWNSTGDEYLLSTSAWANRELFRGPVFAPVHINSALYSFSKSAYIVVPILLKITPSYPSWLNRAGETALFPKGSIYQATHGWTLKVSFMNLSPVSIWTNMFQYSPKDSSFMTHVLPMNPN